MIHEQGMALLSVGKLPFLRSSCFLLSSTVSYPHQQSVSLSMIILCITIWDGSIRIHGRPNQVLPDERTMEVMEQVKQGSAKDEGRYGKLEACTSPGGLCAQNKWLPIKYSP